MTDAWLQVASLNREVVVLRESMQAKDAELASATAAGSSELEDLRSARQELADSMAAAQEQLQVITAHKSKRHLLGSGRKPTVLAAEERKRKDYTFLRQFNEKPNVIPGCPVSCRMSGTSQPS